MNFSITAEVIMQTMRDHVLTGHKDRAIDFLKNTLVGIDDQSIYLLITGKSTLINHGNSFSLVEHNDLDYQQTYLRIEEKKRNDEYYQREITRETLKTLYAKEYLQFIQYYINADKFISFPKSLVDLIISDDVLSNEIINKITEKTQLAPIEQLDLLLNPLESDRTLCETLLSEIRHFGYPFDEIELAAENPAFGRMKGVVKTLDDAKTLKDTDILIYNVNNISECVKHFSTAEKAGAVICFVEDRKMLGHVRLFFKSFDDRDQIPLLIIRRRKEEQYLKLVGKTITLDFKKGYIFVPDLYQ